MKNLNLIAAIGKNNELGIDNHLIWHLPSDLKYFRKITDGKTIIMGRRCFESLPGLLPNRKSIILSTNIDYKVDGALIYHNIEDVINYIKNSGEECFIIGGAKIYEMFLPYVQNIYLTEIDASAKADVFFPIFKKDDYEKEIVDKLEENGVEYKFVVYRRK